MRILLLPGMDGTGELFEEFVQRAPAGLRPFVVRYDAATTHEELLAIVARELGSSEEAVVVLAESFAGPVALRVAAGEYACVAAVVLCNSFVIPPRRWLSVVPWTVMLKVPLPDVALRFFLLGWKAPSHVVGRVKRTIGRVDPHVLAARLGAIARLRAPVPPLRVRVPVLYLRGTSDRLVPEAAIDKIREVAPHLVIERLAASHLLLQLEPDEAWSRISQFLQRRLTSG